MTEELIAPVAPAGPLGLRPGEPGYAEACLAWNRHYRHEPDEVVLATSIEDVVAAVRRARREGRTVAVQATGHGVGLTAGPGSTLLVTQGLAGLTVDPVARTATLGAGLTWAPVLAEAQRHGLAPLLGSTPHVGAVGYTLGGGFGWLGRREGFAADRVRSVTVVLADGTVVEAGPDREPELFWALRGGGAGSLGVVVEMTVDLVPVTDVYGGNLLYPVEQVREVFGRYRAWSEGLPPEMTSAFTVMNFPPLDLVPEPVRGRSFAIVRGCYSGDLADGAALVDEWRRWRQPALDMFGPMPFAQVAEISQDPVDPLPALTTGSWLGGLDEEVLEGMLAATAAPGPVLFAELRHGGGALATPVAAGPAGAIARGDDWLLETVALVTGPEAVPEAEARFGGLWQRLEGQTSRPYLNFIEGPGRVAASRAAFEPAAWERLTAVKRAVDPDRMFSHGVDLATG
ncbi:FAD-binding oxidoreductase [Ornithinicoccus halotolerans]|uniref:FAD-binding oxidoreductase n=1 Tax=Ornithinicoccus halotolerans TaxID=1748220 RepID=UPI001295E12D|nr:FAD-binding oxidoreductase [Ornithinicoccus halotolerans]